MVVFVVFSILLLAVSPILGIEPLINFKVMDRLTPNKSMVSVLATKEKTMDVLVRFPADPIRLPKAGSTVIFDETLYDHPSKPGVPDLPVLYEAVEIPAGKAVQVQILKSRSSHKVLGEGGLPGLIPNREPEIEKCASIIPCQLPFSPSSLQGSVIFPENSVEILGNSIVRGHHITHLAFWPVQYDPTNQTVELFSEIKVRIIISGNEEPLSPRQARVASPAFEGVLSHALLNYQPKGPVNSGKPIPSEAYLIIAPDAFIPSLSSLKDLKESQGYTVTLANLSTTGSSAANIKAYIQNAYDHWSLPPTYVLLVGDVANGTLSMPAFMGQVSNGMTDLYYGTVDGSDWIPDILVGRLPARSLHQLNIMVNNLVAYDHLSGDEAWVKRAALLASDDPSYWALAEETQNYVIDQHTLPEDYFGTYPNNPQPGGDKLYAYSYSAETTNVMNAINSGQSLVAYSGHGSPSHWSGPVFDQSNIRSIASQGAFSVVASFACDTGAFGEVESFGETWLLQPNQGGIAFIGSSASTYWGPDDILQRAMMDALYSGRPLANIIGKFKFAGLMAVEAARPGTEPAQSQHYWESYNLFGDPSLAVLIGPEELPDFQPLLDSSSITVIQTPGDEVHVHLTLTNAGAKLDRISIEISAERWTPDLQTNSIVELNPGETTMVDVVVSVPEDAQLGQTEAFVLQVTSLNDQESPPANDTASIRLSVAKTHTLPLFFSP